ncbi:MAG: carbohydrate porin, partial [Deltaproteobacteria bacterium]|nr:carbohydrate porin [Deltaproteobacteria bacterium]
QGGDQATGRGRDVAQPGHQSSVVGRVAASPPAGRGATQPGVSAGTTENRGADQGAAAAKRAGQTSSASRTEHAVSPKPAPAKARPPKSDTGFAFGSYGRVSASTDGHGWQARSTNIVDHGPRLEETPYLEVDLYYKLKPFHGITFKTVTTLGFTDDLFHYTGDWSSMLALRNLYLEASGVYYKGLTLWVGSRQYRGDDIYLLDFWPLDNLNTLGGGAILDWRRLSVALHAGVNRLRDKYQYQEVAVPGLDNTSEQVVTLDRQRFITSLKVSQRFGGQGGHLGFKVKGYAEIHAIGAGVYNAHLESDKQTKLPADQGWLIGVQVGMWNFLERSSHLNLFFKYAKGLAAYGEMAVPWGLSPDRSAKRAQALTMAVSGNFEWRFLGVLVGGYVQYFRDADGQKYDWDDGWQYAFAVRPQVNIARNFAQVFEVSFQGKWPAGLEPRTETVQRPAVTKFSVMPTLVFGKGTYARPQIRLVYTLALLNRGARLAYNPVDPRSTRKVQHYIGLQAEWWYNSTYR